MHRLAPLAAALLLIASCASTTVRNQMTNTFTADDLARKYMTLVLSMGEHDADYVDAYYGPAELRERVRATKPSLESVHKDALELQTALAALPASADPLVQLRHEYLRRQTSALIARAEMLRGRRMTFDEESQALYDAVAPRHSAEHFEELLAELDRVLPGKGSIPERIDRFRAEFIIPKDKLDAVFTTAINYCREKTLEHIALPEGESFTVEYVTNKSWSGYNWYQGNYRSLIQVNTDLPIYVDRAIDLACHEGYPGHHVYNLLLEKNLVRERGWIEFTGYALFSPQSLIAEGSANYGIEIAFPGEERVEWEKKTLFPLAGINPERAAEYYRVQELLGSLAYAGNEAARGYLNGEMTAQQAIDWLTKYALMSPQRAAQRIRFFDQYRSYVINYNLGKDLVRAYIERNAGTDTKARWELFEQLLSSPRLPSGLR